MLWIGPDGEERRLTFAWFAERAARFANALAAAGIEPGATVFAMLPRVPEWWETFLGSIKGNYVFAPGTCLLTVKDVAYRLEAAEAQVVITDAENAPKVDEALAGGDPATCGRDRADLHRPRRPPGGLARLRGPARCGVPGLPRLEAVVAGPIARVLHVGDDGPPQDGPPHPVELRDRARGDRPLLARRRARRPALDHLRHGLGAVGVEQCLRAVAPGCGRVHPRRPRPVRPRGLARDARALPDHDVLRATDRVPAAGPGAARALPVPRAAAHDRRGRAGQPGARGRVARRQRASRSTSATARPRPCCSRPSSRASRCGRARWAWPRRATSSRSWTRRARACRTATRAIWPCACARIGRSACSASTGRTRSATANCHRGDWYITFDRAIRDERGYFWFVGRSDDVIISAGYRIGPFEVESALLEHPAVVESAAIAHPDPARGNIVKAFVVLAPGFSASPRSDRGAPGPRQARHRARTSTRARSPTSTSCPRRSAARSAAGSCGHWTGRDDRRRDRVVLTVGRAST